MINKRLSTVIFSGLILLAGTSMLLVACSSSTNSNTATPVSNSNKIGINIYAPLDYSADLLYADVIRTSRAFSAGTDPNSTTLATLDPDGWPTSDFSFYIWGSIPNRNGIYTLSFAGKATVTTNPGMGLTTTYDSTSNTTTGTFNYTNTGSAAFAMIFANTQRTSSSAVGSGVTAIKLMSPLTPGATQSYPATTLFTTPIKTLISKFSVIRFMDFLATNSNQQRVWSERPLPAWPSFNRYANKKSPTSIGNYGWQGIGAPLEHAILLANETGKDAWINIPALVDDTYIGNVAKMLAYGSDGVNPYSSTQANPVYPPLNSSLHVYIEYSNEVWNSSSAFIQSYDNCQMASDELAAGNSPLNWDNSWNNVTYKNPIVNGVFTTVDNSAWNYSFCFRRPAKRTVEISNIFRGVFGDAAMMTRVRPVMMSQLGASGRSLYDETKMLLNYYNHMAGDFAGAPPAHPPSYYIYGAGGSGYYNVTAPSALTTVDQVFSSNDMLPAGFATKLQPDAKYAAALGVKRIAYEGGPSFDNVNSTVNAIYAQAVLDPRIKTAMIDMHNEWSADGGDLLTYFISTGDPQWGFTADVNNLGTYKLAAIDALNSTDRAPITLGTLFPASLAGSAADVCSRGWGCSPIASYDNFTADGSKFYWASYTFRSNVSAPWTVTLTVATPAANSSIAVYVDGVQVDVTKNATAGIVSFNAGTIGSGIHDVAVRAVTGSFALSTIAVN